MALFKKNQKDADQSGDPLNPRQPRFACVVSVGINGFEGKAILSNMSVDGFRMESKTYAAIAPGERYVIQIQPEVNSGLRAFDMEVEVRWVKSAETRFSAGFRITRRPADRSFERYLEYARTRAA
jgi:hypothetical protein